MYLSNIIAKKVFLPLNDIFTGQSIYKTLSFLDKSQFWTRDQINEYQNDKLRRLIHHAYVNVPFYRELFLDLKLKPEDVQTKDDLIKLPIITKDDLRRNKTKWKAKNIKNKGLVFSSSSGSTGEPFQFYTTKFADSFQKASAIRGWYWMGYKLGDRYVKTSVRPRSSFVKKIQDKMNSSLFLSFNHYRPEVFRQINNDILKFDPLIIRGYPVPLMFLSEQIAADFGQYSGKSLKAINSTGSTLHSNQRMLIEKCFNVKVFDSYSCEGGANFFQCPTHNNYHPSEEYAISEYIKDNYSLSDPEHPLRHITTDLHNYVNPFIRYDTQDYIVLGDNNDCTCGRKFKNIKKIRGRDTDILITPSGKCILMENILGYFEDGDKVSQHVTQVQVVQDEIDKIIFNIVVNKSFTAETLKEMIDYWQNFIGNDVNVVIKAVDKILLTPSGKRRTVIRNPNIKLDGR